MSAVTLVQAPEIALGDALGSCVFNLMIVTLLDLLQREESVFTRASQGHFLSAGFGIILIGLVGFSLSIHRAVAGYSICALIVVATGTFLPFVGEGLAAIMGWQQTFVGTLFVAFATSAPEDDRGDHRRSALPPALAAVPHRRLVESASVCPLSAQHLRPRSLQRMIGEARRPHETRSPGARPGGAPQQAAVETGTGCRIEIETPHPPPIEA